MSSVAPIFTPTTRERIRVSTDLDALLFGSCSPFDLPLADQRAQREWLVREAYLDHFERTPTFRRFVQRRGFDAAAIERASLDELPVYPTTVFKKAPPLGIDEAFVEKWCLSSGTTSTSRSRVPRDRLTIERLLGSVRAGISLLTDRNEDEVSVLNLGPSRREAGDVWFGYVMSLVELLYPTTSRVERGVLQADAAIADLDALLDSNEEVVVIGPPYMMIALADALAARGRKLAGDERLTVITAGGWKRFAGAAVTRDELDARLGDVLGLASSTQVRDAFNQVELNTVLMECEAREKHVPAWVHAVARDPATLRALAPGEVGLLSYLDASAESYPCFIVGEDLGVIHEGPCACGREGTRLRVERRVRGTPARGCALTMGQQAREEDKRWETRQ